MQKEFNKKITVEFDYDFEIEENENYYAWHTFALVDESLYSVTITAKTDIKKGKFDLNGVQVEVQTYVKNVLERYEFYKRENGFVQLGTLLFGIILLLTIFFKPTYIIDSNKQLSTVTPNSKVLGVQTNQKIEDYNFNGGFLESGRWEITINIKEDENALIRIEQEKKESALTTYYTRLYLLIKGEKKLIAENIGGPLSWVKLVDLDKNYPKELLFETVEGHLAHTRFIAIKTGHL